MAAYSQTATSVLYSSGGELSDGILGGSVTAGMPVYQDTDSSWKAASNASAAAANVKAMALTGGAVGQPVKLLKPGTVSNPAIINLGTTLDVGKVLVLGTGGAILPVDDVTTGIYCTVIGIAQTASLALFQPIVSGVATAGGVS